MYTPAYDLTSRTSYPPIESGFVAVNSTKSDVAIKLEEVSEDEYDDQDDNQVEAKHGTVILKGVIWPGMDLFDSASEEARRMRNQRKNYSVCEILERHSGMVEATETVSSADRVMLKQRALEDMENDSPVEGEIMVRKPPVKKRRRSTQNKPRQVRARKDNRRSRHEVGASVKAVTPASAVNDANDTAHATGYVAIDDSDNEGPAYKRALHDQLGLEFSVYNDEAGQHATDSTQPDVSTENVIEPNLSEVNTAMYQEHANSMSQLPSTPHLQHIKMEASEESEVKADIPPFARENMQFFGGFAASNTAAPAYSYPVTPTRQLNVLPPSTPRGSRFDHALGFNPHDRYSARDDYLSEKTPFVSRSEYNIPIKLEEVDLHELIINSFNEYHE